MRGFWFPVVTSVHVLIAAFFLRGSLPAPPAPSHVAVHTVKLQPAPPPTKPKEKPKPKEVPKFRIEPKPKKKREAVVKRASKPKPRKGRRLLTEAQQKLKGLEKASPAPAPLQRIPLAVDQPLGKMSLDTYAKRLIDRLQLALRLPEYGPVTVELTLSKSGQVRRILICSTQSETNRAYVGEQLPKLAFEPLERCFPGQEEHTFVVTLSNEI